MDVVGVLNQETDHIKAGNYWRWLKRKLTKENIQFVSHTHKLKLMAADGTALGVRALVLNLAG